MDELKDKAEEFGDKAQEGFGSAKDKVIENVKDRFDGDDETPTGSGESVGYSSEGAEGIKEARSSFEDATATAQDSAEGIGEAPLEAPEPAASSVDEALGAQEAAEDRQTDSV